MAQIEYPKSAFKFQKTEDYQFRNTDANVVLRFGQIDFDNKTHPEPINSSTNVAENDSLPKFWSEKL
jgi:hypothetical protein